MPFKSEKQRKYLWANEPEIARDWTDTYGSRIQKAGGQLVQPGPGRPGYQGPAGGASAGGDYGGNVNPDQSYAGRTYRDQPYASPESIQRADQQMQANKVLAQLKADKKEEAVERFRNKQQGILSNQRTRNFFLNKVLDAKRWEGLDEDEDFYDLSPSKQEAKYGEYMSQRVGGNIDAYGNPIDTSDRGEGGGEIPWWLQQPAPVADTGTGSSTVAGLGLGQGHFQVPLDLVVNQQRAAEGGMIGSVGGTSRQKYQEGNMVGAEMEGAMMQSQEVIKELYDALIAQGLSPQEAIEKIKEIIASSQEQGPESPMMGEEFPGQEFGGGPRAPAAFGGIMDTYSGRRKYGLGSFNPFKAVKKGVSKLKKLASSKLGKIALGYIATAGLSNYLAGAGGVGAAGGQPWTKFQWLKPGMLKQNLGTNVSSLSNLFSGGAQKVVEEGAKKAAPWYKNPWVSIPAASVAAGLYTAKQPLDELDDTQEEWDKEKEEWDKYYAGLGGSYRLPEDLRAAHGGRIGYGLGSMVKRALGLGTIKGTAEADPGRVEVAQDPDVRRKKLMDYFKAKFSGEDWFGAQGGRIGRQEGGLMDLGGMEKDYRDDGGFVPLGGEEKADDVPARLSRNEFVFTADAVRNAGGGDIDKGAEVMENVMKNLEAGGKVSEESQGQGAEEMFEVSERLSEVV